LRDDDSGKYAILKDDGSLEQDAEIAIRD